MAKYKRVGGIYKKENDVGELIAGVIIWAVIIGVLAVMFG